MCNCERLLQRTQEAEARTVKAMEVAIDLKERLKLANRRIEILREDTKLLDYLASLDTKYGSGWVLRESTTGRGMRLHETSLPDSAHTPRAAIRAHMKGNDV